MHSMDPIYEQGQRSVTQPGSAVDQVVVHDGF